MPLYMLLCGLKIKKINILYSLTAIIVISSIDTEFFLFNNIAYKAPFSKRCKIGLAIEWSHISVKKPHVLDL